VTSAPEVDVVSDHAFVIHLVDVIARKDQDVVHVVAVDDVDVLGHRVGRAAIPLGFAHPLAGGQDVEVLVALGAEKTPAALTMADQGMGLVLRRNRHLADAGIERVGQREVHDARLAAEIYRRFGAPCRSVP
jgi:hypothetical protein